MENRIVCPYYGKDEDICDLGCGYISPSDVDIIIKFCSSSHTDCTKYRELAERRPEKISDTPAPSPVRANLSPQEDRPAPDLSGTARSATFSKEGTGMTDRTASSSFELDSDTANPAPLGLLGLGMTTVLLGLHHAGLFPLDAMFLGMGIFYGGIGQILVGILEWKKNNTFGATAYTSFGLFWLSLIALIFLPQTGFGKPPTPSAMVAYMCMWGLFTAILFLGTLRLNRALQTTFGLLVLFFALLALGDATGSAAVRTVAGWEGTACGLVAIYAGLAQLMNEVYGRTVAPLGEMSKSS